MASVKSELAAHLTMLDVVARRSHAFDILHFHLDMLHFPMFEHIAAKAVTTVHGRLDVPANHYRFIEQGEDDYLAFLGRIAPEKHPTVAIDLASRARMPLKMAAKANVNDLLYFSIRW